jgi:hypothetical protein
MSCKSTKEKWKTKITDYFLLKYPSDNAVMRTIYSKGPVVVMMNAGDREFLIYK